MWCKRCFAQKVSCLRIKLGVKKVTHIPIHPWVRTMACMIVLGFAFAGTTRLEILRGPVGFRDIACLSPFSWWVLRRQVHAGNYSHTADVFSVGCCVHQLLAGEVPWEGVDVRSWQLLKVNAFLSRETWRKNKQIIYFEWSPPWHVKTATLTLPSFVVVYLSGEGFYILNQPHLLLYWWSPGLSASGSMGLCIGKLTPYISQSPCKQPRPEAHIVSPISSTSLSGISPDILWHITWQSFWYISWHPVWHSFSHIFWWYFWHIGWHSFWHIIWGSFLAYLLTFCLILLLTYLLTFLLTFFLTYLLTFLSGISSDILSDMSSDNLFWHIPDILSDFRDDISSDILTRNLSDIFTDRSSDILSDFPDDISSGILTHNLSDILSVLLSDFLTFFLIYIYPGSLFGISPDILSDILSHISSDCISDISAGILSDISSEVLFWHISWHFVWYCCWRIFWHSYWHSFWHIFWHSFWLTFWHSFPSHNSPVYQTFCRGIYVRSRLSFQKLRRMETWYSSRIHLELFAECANMRMLTNWFVVSGCFRRGSVKISDIFWPSHHE